LHHAIRMGEFEIARMLLAHGADPRIRDIDGKASYDCCWEGGWEGIFGAGFQAWRLGDRTMGRSVSDPYQTPGPGV
jgi:hypothetical protein